MRVAVVAPAKAIDGSVAARVGALALGYPGLDLAFHPQCFESDGGHFAGTDARRASAFLDVANDPAIDAIWFARGGYGSNRLLATAMPRLGPAARGKAYLGYSDMGFLLAALYARRIGRVAHGPMPIDIAREGGEAAVARSLGWLTGKRDGVEPGLGARPAAAFNLAILSTLIGTPWLPDLADHVLIVEEVSEPLYAIDRMLFHLAGATQLKGLAGIRLGSVTDIKDNDPPWGETLETMMARWCGELGVPFLGRARVGHDVDNHVVPFGLS